MIAYEEFLCQEACVVDGMALSFLKIWLFWQANGKKVYANNGPLDSKNRAKWAAN